MRIGFMPDTHATDYAGPQPERKDVVEFYDHLIESSKLAEEAGFDGLFVPDRHMRTETYWPSQLHLLTTLASITDTMTLGPYVNVLSCYNPMQVAEEMAVLDNLSEGRAIYAGGRGYHEGYWQYFGIEDGPSKALGRFVEGVEVLKEAWGSTIDDRFSYDGKYHQYEEVYQSPDPFQNPRPPIWLGGQVDPAVERAGRLGDGYCAGPDPTEEEKYSHQLDLYREKQREHGSPVYDEPVHVLMRDGFVAESEKLAEEIFGERFREEMLFYFNQDVPFHHPKFDDESDFTIDNLKKVAMILGDPEAVIEEIERYDEDFGVDYLIMRFRVPKGPSWEKERQAIELFGEEVIPHFHGEDDGDWVLND